MKFNFFHHSKFFKFKILIALDLKFNQTFLPKSYKLEFNTFKAPPSNSL